MNNNRGRALSSEDCYDFIRESLERHQKFVEQHPELYQGKDARLVIILPLVIAKIDHIHTWFIPFSNKFNIDVIFFVDNDCFYECLYHENFFLLKKVGVNVSCDIFGK